MGKTVKNGKLLVNLLILALLFVIINKIRIYAVMSFKNEMLSGDNTNNKLS